MSKTLRPTALAVAVVLSGATAAAFAEPLSHVQTVRDGEGDVEGLVSNLALEVTDDAVFVAGGNALHHFSRDPVTGRLELVERIASFEPESPVAPGDVDPYLSLGSLPDGRLLVAGRSRDPADCAGEVPRNCFEIGPTVYSIVDGRLVNGGANDAGSVDDMVVSPDGRHVYGSSYGTSRGPLGTYAVQSSGLLMPVEDLSTFRADGSRAIVGALAVSPDGERVYVITGFNGDDAVLTSLDRDAASGRLAPIADLDLTALGLESGIGVPAPSVSPDGRAVWLGLRSVGPGDGRTGLARVDVDEGGRMSLGDVDDAAEAFVPSSLGYPGVTAVSPNGRLVAVPNANGVGGVEESIHLFTVDDARDTTWRGLEYGGSDGVLESDIRGVTRLEFSPDGAYLYAGGTQNASLVAFAAHADLQAGIEAPRDALAGGEASSTVRLFNAGPASSHGVVATIEASGPIGSAAGDGADCEVAGATATCRVDELTAMAGAEIRVVAAVPASGALAFEVSATQYQTDLDASSNAAAASVAAVADASQVSGQTVSSGADAAPGGADGSGGPRAPDDDAGPVGADGDGAGDDSSGGGCSIATGAGPDPMSWLLALGAFGSLVARRRRVRASRPCERGDGTSRERPARHS